jgi:hypothetical protein
MGYVHDTGMSQYIPPTAMHYVTGTWVDSAGVVAHTISRKKNAADETATVTIPVPVPGNSAASKGSYVKSIEIDFEVVTAALDSLDAAIYKLTRGADGSAFTAASQSFTYDSGHDAAAERIDVDQHRMTLTLDTPLWIDNDEELIVELSLNAAATSVFHMMGAVANYTFRA